VGENVADLADRDDGAARLREAIEKRGRRRHHGIILAVGGAGEIAGSSADEGAGNDAADVQFIGQFAGNPADVIEMLEAEAFFVRCNLDDTVSTCIDNRLAAAHVFRAEFLDDLGAGGVLVSENAGKPRPLDQFIGQ